jgi:hypothetical protein
MVFGLDCVIVPLRVGYADGCTLLLVERFAFFALSYIYVSEACMDDAEMSTNRSKQ